MADLNSFDETSSKKWSHYHQRDAEMTTTIRYMTNRGNDSRQSTAINSAVRIVFSFRIKWNQIVELLFEISNQIE